jgi:hypothetical protein
VLTRAVVLFSVGCVFSNNVRRLARAPEFQPAGERQIWDIEDIVEAGISKGASPAILCDHH